MEVWTVRSLGAFCVTVGLWVCILELLWLEDVAKDEAYEFTFLGAPIKVRGATGSPIRPLAFPIHASDKND